MSEPQLVVELSQTDAIPSTSNKSLENKAAESDPESAEEDVEHDCEYHDYPSSEVTESTDSDSDQDLWVQGRGRGRGQGRSRRGRKQPSEPDGEDLSAGWAEDVHLPDVTFDTERVGPQNMPECFDASTRELDYLNLFLDGEFWDLLCTNTNLYAAQVKALHPNRYYAKSYKSASVPEMKAFVGLRLMMEKTVVKPRYENYWQGEAHNFMSFTPGFRDVMERDPFLALWTFLHLVDQQDPNIDKSDKIYKVRPMLDVLLPRFRHHYNPGQQLSLDEGMIPTKNRLAIKQYIKDKPIKWGIKCFMLCEGRTGYIVSAEIYTGKDQARHIEHLGSSGSVVVRLVEDAEISGQNHIIFMDRYFNSVALFSHLYDKMGTFAAGTARPNRKHYPRDLIMRRLPERGLIEFKCRNNLAAVVWMDKRCINFLSSCHDPRKVKWVNRRNKDGTQERITCPELTADYNQYMGGCDKNDQLTRLDSTRRHYRWPRRLFIKFVMWACYNAYILMATYAPHQSQGRRVRTFRCFLDQLCLQLVGDYRSAAQRLRPQALIRLQNVGAHFPERADDASGNNVCCVCSHKYRLERKRQPASDYKDLHDKKRKSKFWCRHCHRYLCIRKGSTCWEDWHTKVQYWR